MTNKECEEEDSYEVSVVINDIIPEESCNVEASFTQDESNDPTTSMSTDADTYFGDFDDINESIFRYF